jgi:hypothetical protein
MSVGEHVPAQLQYSEKKTERQSEKEWESHCCCLSWRKRGGEKDLNEITGKNSWTLPMYPCIFVRYVRKIYILICAPYSLQKYILNISSVETGKKRAPTLVRLQLILFSKTFGAF